MKKINITEKLDFETNPVLIIKDKEYPVNADATTVLKLMNLVSDEKGFTNRDILEAYELLLPEKTRSEINKLGISFADLTVIVEAAMDLATGDTGEGGEKQ